MLLDPILQFSHTADRRMPCPGRRSILADTPCDFRHKTSVLNTEHWLNSPRGVPPSSVSARPEDGDGAIFSYLVWNPVVLIEMRKRSMDLRKRYRHAFDYPNPQFLITED